MENMLADYSTDAASQYSNAIDSRYTSASDVDECGAEAVMSPRPSVDTSLNLWDRLSDQAPREQETTLSVRQMSEFAKHIEESAASSSAWTRVGGTELSSLRLSFRNLLRRLLSELDPGARSRWEEYEAICQSSLNGDIILAYHFAYLLSAAVALGHAEAATRVEVGFRSSSTELTCFLAERSAGITIRKNDNLFALCTNGKWGSERRAGEPSLNSLRTTVEKYGGKLSREAMDGGTVKVIFAV